MARHNKRNIVQLNKRIIEQPNKREIDRIYGVTI